MTTKVSKKTVTLTLPAKHWLSIYSSLGTILCIHSPDTLAASEGNAVLGFILSVSLSTQLKFRRVSIPLPTSLSSSNSTTLLSI